MFQFQLVIGKFKNGEWVVQMRNSDGMLLTQKNFQSVDEAKEEALRVLAQRK